MDPFDAHLEEQIENARTAGWDVGQPGDPDYPREPPAGWDAHGKDPGPVEVLEGPTDG